MRHDREIQGSNYEIVIQFYFFLLALHFVVDIYVPVCKFLVIWIKW